MNLAFLGDALDHWKGSLFESLQRSIVLRDFAVDPMASDWSKWQPEDISLFTRLLRIDKSQLIPHNIGLTNRKRYFDEIEHPGDLFLDPDTGNGESQQYRSVRQTFGNSAIASRL